jgi:uncharacterized membrane protein YuzA (DUF378 family)
MIMNTPRPTVIVLVIAAILVGVSQDLALAALFDDQTSVLDGVVYLLIGLALVIGIIAVFNNDFLTRILGRLGDSSGDERGPKPGDGAVIHHSSGEADFDGSPGNVPPSIKDTNDTNRDLPFPPHKSAD